ncbi:MAG TPA: hypothetical protein VF092_16035 [Longimicrobium sp.]
MAVAEYYAWNRAGRPVLRPRWLTEVKAAAAAAGVPFLGDLGSDNYAHLQNPFPQDHCPFSYTEWPVQLTGYWINAIDLGAGPWFWAFLERARAGEYPWLKYVNAYGMNWSCRRNYFRDSVPSSDTHCHMSGRTDMLDAPMGRSPFVATPPAPPKDGNRYMTTIYHKDGTGAGPDNPALYAMAGESPGTPANWLETYDYQFAVDLVLIHHPPAYARARTLSVDTWDTWKAAYLAPLSTDEVEPVEPVGDQPAALSGVASDER